jgi:hypothetical protein
MAVPVVAAVEVGPVDSTSPVSVTVPAGWSVGDLAFAMVHTYNRTVSTPASGWTAINSPQFSGSVRTYLYWKILVSGDIGAAAGWSLSADPSVGRVTLVQVTGHDPTTPINVSAGQQDDYATSHVSPTVTTTANDCLILRLMSSDYNPGGWTASSGDTGTSVAAGTTAPPYSVRKSSLATAGSTGTGTFTTSNTAMQLFTVAVAPTSGGAAKPVLFHQHYQNMGWR